MKALSLPQDFHVFLQFSPETGFIWRSVPTEYFARPQDALTWNRKFSGKIAGGVAVTPYGRKIKVVRIKGRSFGLHNVSFLMFNGPIPKGCIVDFKDGDWANVDPANLFLSTEIKKVTEKANKKHVTFLDSEKFLHLIDRNTALGFGMTRYFSIRPCPRGHRGERTVNGWGCCACADAARATPERKAYVRDFAARNAAGLKSYMAAWKIENISRKKKSDAAWKRDNKEAVYASNRKRQLAKDSRILLASQGLTDFVFAEANHLAKLRKKRFGIRWEVDHVLPLFGREVSGLHVWNNFQVIPAEINRLKKDNLTFIEPFSWMRHYA